MTRRARLFPYVPLAILLSIALPFVVLPGWPAAVAAPLVLYLLPVALYRLHGRLWPITEGLSALDASGYAPWWGGHQCQLLYDAVPTLEALLRLVPGLYSAWLRLWGSRVGRAVHWTPRVEVTDRGFLAIGDGVLVGHRVGFYPHVVTRREDGRLVLYLKRISIGHGALLGAGSRLGPGASIPARAVLPSLSDVGIGRSGP